MKEAFFNTLLSISPLSPETVSDLDQCLTAAYFPKQAIVVHEGELSDKMFFITKGSARAFFFDGNKEYTDWFSFENMFMCSLLSFFGGLPSAQTIQTLEDSEMLLLTRGQLLGLCNKHPDMQKLYGLILSQSLVILQQNVIDQRFKTAQERYVVLRKTFPQAIQRVPLKYIASFLGITQETLSRIRAAGII